MWDIIQLVLYEIGEFLVTANLVRHPHSSLATSRNLLVFLVFAPYITNSIRFLMVLEQIGRDCRPRVTTMAAPPEPGEPGMGV